MAVATSTAILGAAIIGGGAGIAGSLIAAGEEEQAFGDASGLLREYYEQARADLEPFKVGGTESFNRFLATTKGDFAGFTESPGFRFRLGEGIKAIDRSAASRGSLLSGATLKGVQRFGEGLAAEEFQNFQNRLAQASGIGLSAAQSQAGLANNFANSLANLTVGGGRARSQGITGAASAVNQTGNNIINSLLLSQALSGGGGGGGGGP